MSRPRLYLPTERWGRAVSLQPDERHYLVDVLRLQPGSQVEVFDGQGTRCPAEIALEQERWSLLLGEAERTERERPEVHLGMALLKGRKFDDLIRMISELGVLSFTPVLCARSVSRPEAGKGQGKADRWQKIAEQAARQSKQATVCRLLPPASFEQWLERAEPSSARLILHEETRHRTLLDLLEAHPSPRRFLLVGPEGGFSPEEIEKSSRYGFLSVGLGLPVLRAETAAITACALACLDRTPRLSNSCK